MTKMAHALDGYLGVKLVSSWEPPRRRKSAQELAAMPIEARLIYQAANPLSAEEQLEQLEQELAWADWDLTGELDAKTINDNQPPPEWGT